MRGAFFARLQSIAISQHSVLSYTLDNSPFQSIQFNPIQTTTMNTSRFLIRAVARQQVANLSKRSLSTSTRTLFKAETDAVSPQVESKDRNHSNVEDFRKTQTDRPLNPHLTNTTSANVSSQEKEVPKLGFDKPPPEFLSKVDPDFTPKDRHPENTDRMTGETQPGNPDKVSQNSSSSKQEGEFGVGEMEGAEFKIEPLRRVGEDTATMRARLLCS